MTFYDVVLIPLLILLAMFLAKQPKRAAIAFCAVVSLSKIPIEFIDNDWAGFAYTIPVEFIAGLALIWIAGIQDIDDESLDIIKLKEDRIFYRLMGVMFWVSAVVHYQYIFGCTVFEDGYVVYQTEQQGLLCIDDYETYVTISHTVGYFHVALMMVYTDGAKRLARNFADFMRSLRLDQVRP